MEFYTMKEVAEMLKISRVTIMEMVKAGKLRVYRPGRKFLFSKQQIEDFLNNVLTA